MGIVVTRYRKLGDPMLIIRKIENYSTIIINTDTETEFRIPTHWLQEDVQAGDVIKVIKDEVSSQRIKKEAEELEKRYNIKFNK